MSTRRGQGEGSISQRASDGLWTARVDLGYVNGKRKRKQIYGKTRKEVAEALKILLRDQQVGNLDAVAGLGVRRVAYGYILPLKAWDRGTLTSCAPIPAAV